MTQRTGSLPRRGGAHRFPRESHALSSAVVLVLLAATAIWVMTGWLLLLRAF